MCVSALKDTPTVYPVPAWIELVLNIVIRQLTWVSRECDHI